MCNKANIMKRFFIVTNNSSNQLQPIVVKVLRFQPYIENIHKMNQLYEQQYLNERDIKELNLDYKSENKLQLIPFEIPASYFLS